MLKLCKQTWEPVSVVLEVYIGAKKIVARAFKVLCVEVKTLRPVGCIAISIK